MTPIRQWPVRVAVVVAVERRRGGERGKRPRHHRERQRRDQRPALAPSPASRQPRRTRRRRSGRRTPPASCRSSDTTSRRGPARPRAAAIHTPRSTSSQLPPLQVLVATGNGDRLHRRAGSVGRLDISAPVSGRGGTRASGCESGVVRARRRTAPSLRPVSSKSGTNASVPGCRRCSSSATGRHLQNTTSTPNQPGASARMNAPSVVTHRRPENRIISSPSTLGTPTTSAIAMSGRILAWTSTVNATPGQQPDRATDQHRAGQQPRTRKRDHAYDLTSVTRRGPGTFPARCPPR